MDYYKITNKKEEHRGMRYKTGLNIDSQPFHPYGSCTGGGIYFTRKDILSFLDYGPWIRKVTIPKNARVYADPDVVEKWKANRVRLGKRTRITLPVIKRLVKEGADPNADNSRALRSAVITGCPARVKYFILQAPVNPFATCIALRVAVLHAEPRYVKILVDFGSYSKATLAETLAISRRCPPSGCLEILTKKIKEY